MALVAAAGRYIAGFRRLLCAPLYAILAEIFQIKQALSLQQGRRQDELPSMLFRTFAVYIKLAMTKTRITLLVVAGLAAAYGLPSAIGSFFLDDVTYLFRVASFIVGLLLLVGAGLLVLERSAGAILLWLSAATYAAVMLVPAIHRHGIEAFSVLMGAFYLSLTVRIGLAAAAHFLVRRRHG